ncbi:helix-turn-helix domain-containing protein [Gluconacetobacter takamatsuzukensis]|uniref:Helix-turn-helix transcriptional regulator n=1 Tax=Gluconacetobacter takamatsuzukensis TaxID=1286190 RepID=A0A7W4KCP7_9PROT|nr:helix-turn-helix transcriptional regulator [Gluconacetobacter takamatsuzukensis]MBB2204471.1 helix-turn-helix transcriptional regulator [Gluconacetobacter takamatsuzukensis]
MARRILLQPGQIWTPQDPSLPARRVRDLPRGRLSYTEISPSCPAGSTPTGQAGHLVTPRLFREWIRAYGATLAGNDGEKASPSAELAKKIVTLRSACGMSQSGLATALGLSRSAVAALETGRSSARIHIPRLAELFHVPVELFLSGMTEQTFPMDLSMDEHDLIDLYRRLPVALKISVQKYVERQTRQAEEAD